MSIEPPIISSLHSLSITDKDLNLNIEPLFKKAIGDFEGGEILFWKVFNNKFLLNTIIYQIQSTEWVRYDNHYQYNTENRWCFKDIYSFDWMILKGQYPILLNKIKFNDFILFSEKSIEVLFEKISILYGTLEKKKKSSLLKEKEIDPLIKVETEKLELEQLMEILKILMNPLPSPMAPFSRRLEFEVWDLTYWAIKSNCIIAVNLLINEPYSLMVYPSSIELAIKTSSPEMIKELFQLPNDNGNGTIRKNILLTDEIKLKSIKFALDNSKYSLEMVKLILNNPILYSTPPTSPDSKEFEYYEDYQEEEQKIEEEEEEVEEVEEGSYHSSTSSITKPSKKIKSSLSSSSSPSSHLISFSKLCSLKCIKTMKLIMDLKIVKKPEHDFSDFFNEFFSIDKTFEELLILIEAKFFVHGGFYNKIPKIIKKKIEIISNDDEADQQIKLKRLQKLVLLEFEPQKLLKQYIIKYNESIDDKSDGFYSCDQDEHKDIKYTDQEINESKFLSLFRFINLTLYLQNTELVRSMKQVRSNNIKWFPLLDLIEEVQEESMNDPIILFKNKSEIDWLAENSEKCSALELFLSSNKKKFNFNSIENANYGHEKFLYSSMYEMHKTTSFVHLFQDAIEKCDIEQLQKMDEGFRSLNFIDIKLPHSKNDLLKLVDYIFNTNGKEFLLDRTSFENLFKEILKVVPPSDIKVDFSKVLDFDANELILTSMIDLNFELFKLTVYNLEEIKFTPTDYENLADYEANLFGIELNLFFNEEGFVVFDELYSLFTFLIEKFKKKNRATNKDFSTSGSVIAIINYFYKMLLQSVDVTISQVISIHQLLSDNSIPIDHTLFHSFYYLQIRSAKFMKYIMMRPGLKEFLDFNFISAYNSTTLYPESSEGLDLKKYLLPEVFTFEFIFDVIKETNVYVNSFDQVLYQLVSHLSHQICENHLIKSTFMTDSLNADLEYFLEIQRFDLFFKQLQFIQLKLDQTLSKNYTFEDEINDLFLCQEYIYDSPATTLKPASTLFADREKPPLPPLPQKESDELEWDLTIPYPRLVYMNTFNFSDSVLDIACTLMDVEQVQKLIEWNWNRFQFQSIIFTKSILWSRFDIVEFLLENYEIPIFCIPQFSFDTHYSYRMEFEYFVEKHFDLIQFSYNLKIRLNEFNDSTFPIGFQNIIFEYLSNSKKDSEYQQFINPITREKCLDELIFKLRETYGEFDPEDDLYFDPDREFQCKLILQSKETQSILERVYKRFKIKLDAQRILEKEKQILEHPDQDDNMFCGCFVAGDIRVCELMLKYYPKQFKITENSIKDVVDSNRIHIVKYYYKNPNPNLINNLKDDKPLLDYLKLKLLNHNDYKYDLDWLN